MSGAGNVQAKAEEGQRGFIGSFNPKPEQRRISRPQSAEYYTKLEALEFK